MDVVQAIESVKTNSLDQPMNDITILNIDIIT
jgi:hypothetical protein